MRLEPTHLGVQSNVDGLPSLRYADLDRALPALRQSPVIFVRKTLDLVIGHGFGRMPVAVTPTTVPNRLELLSRSTLDTLFLRQLYTLLKEISRVATPRSAQVTG